MVDDLMLFWDIAKSLSAWCQLLYAIANSDIIVTAGLELLTEEWKICRYK